MIEYELLTPTTDNIVKSPYFYKSQNLENILVWGGGAFRALLPEGLLCRRPQNFDVRLSVRYCVVAICLDHFLDPEMCDIALNNPIDRKKEGKKEVSP